MRLLTKIAKCEDMELIETLIFTKYTAIFIRDWFDNNSKLNVHKNRFIFDIDYFIKCINCIELINSSCYITTKYGRMRVRNGYIYINNDTIEIYDHVANLICELPKKDYYRNAIQ